MVLLLTSTPLVNSWNRNKTMLGVWLAQKLTCDWFAVPFRLALLSAVDGWIVSYGFMLSNLAVFTLGSCGFGIKNWVFLAWKFPIFKGKHFVSTCSDSKFNISKSNLCKISIFCIDRWRSFIIKEVHYFQFCLLLLPRLQRLDRIYM